MSRLNVGCRWLMVIVKFKGWVFIEWLFIVQKTFCGWTGLILLDIQTKSCQDVLNFMFRQQCLFRVWFLYITQKMAGVHKPTCLNQPGSYIERTLGLPIPLTQFISLANPLTGHGWVHLRPWLVPTPLCDNSKGLETNLLISSDLAWSETEP